MINKILTSGLCGASLIAAFLLFNGFNPAHNKPWLIGAGLIAATSTAIAELTTRKKPQPTLNNYSQETTAYTQRITQAPTQTAPP